MPRLQFQDGMRDKTNIIHGPDGYSYYGNTVMKGGRLYIRCWRNHRFRCNGSASIRVGLPDGDFRRCTRHNHPPDLLLIHERRLRHSVLNRCRTGDLSQLKDIYQEEKIRLRTPDQAAANVTFQQLRPAMQAARSEGLPNIPHSLTDLANVLQDPQWAGLTMTLDELDSIFAGVVGQTAQGTRAVLFFSRRMLRYLRKVKQIFSDGTFVVPQNLGCSQIWVFCSVRNHHLIVIGWALMQSKSTEAYVTVLRALQRLQPQFRPTQVMCDFELPEQAAWRIVHPNAEKHGCHVHLTRDVGNMARTLGLHGFLHENEQADNLVRSLCAIPLLKTEDMVDGFLEVLDEAIQLQLEELTEMFDYFQRTWLTPARLRVLSVHGCPDRTNNVCESHNRTLRNMVKVKHPNIYQLIAAFVKYEDWTKSSLVPIQNGKILNTRRISTLLHDEMIQGLTRDLEEGVYITKKTFLRRASRRMAGVFAAVLH